MPAVDGQEPVEALTAKPPDEAFGDGVRFRRPHGRADTPTACCFLAGAPALADDVLRDGWYWTGDMASRDEEGSFWFEGRDE